jgi:divalent metal cation (Fe/Co/Zn/Cd) transporter
VVEVSATVLGGREVLVRRIKMLSWLSLVWMTVEGVVGVTAGIAANSIALIGYGLDSTIAGVGSLIIIWRFTGARVESDAAEQRAQRIVAVTFFLLAPYIAVEAVRRLLAGSEAEGSWVGVALATVSVVLMPYFGRAKKRIGDQLQSSATTGEGIQNILCGYLSLAILVGLAANAVFGLWWADPLVALVVAVAAVHAGLRTWRGDACGDAC